MPTFHQPFLGPHNHYHPLLDHLPQSKFIRFFFFPKFHFKLEGFFVGLCRLLEWLLYKVTYRWSLALVSSRKGLQKQTFHFLGISVTFDSIPWNEMFSDRFCIYWPVHHGALYLPLEVTFELTVLKLYVGKAKRTPPLLLLTLTVNTSC